MLTARDAPALEDALAALRVREFSRLERQGLAYLDYTGSALYADRQVRAHQTILRNAVLGNPHSENEPARASSSLIAQARADVLRFFAADPDEYTVCFTANASTAVKLVAESYPFGPNAGCVLAADNHNSVNGLREFARRAGGRVSYLPLDDELRLLTPLEHLAAERPFGENRAIFAFPAQSNFSGVQHSLPLIGDAQRLGFDVLLDAAAYAPSHSLSLREERPEFITVSFYKLFGYPTGVGALIARRDALARLRRPWFAGGTVTFVSVQNNDMHQLRAGEEGFEDGTPDFLNIAALSSGFELLADVGMMNVQAHVAELAARLLHGLEEATHHDGASLVRVYGPNSMADRGGTVAFNILSSDGRLVPCAEVECRARDAGVAVRSGCFCNPGASEHAFGWPALRARACYSHASDEATHAQLAACLGESIAVGAVRASVGLATNAQDVDRLLTVLRTFAC